MIAANNKKQVLQQELALDTYLQNLLDDVPAYEPQLAHVELKKPVPVEIVEAPKPAQLPAPIPKKEAVNKIQVIPEPVVENIPVSALAIMPDWAQQQFQALFFKVGSMILATPLTELSRTLKFDRVITKIPNQPSWFMGLLQDQGDKLGVLDAGQLIFGKAIGQSRNLDDNPFKSMLVTQDGRWALACDELLSIGKVEPGKVRWRTDRKKRPWLIGTVTNELTAIIDVRQLTPNRPKK